jgi:membrane fusion protein, multidrug efflux system
MKSMKGKKSIIIALIILIVAIVAGRIISISSFKEKDKPISQGPKYVRVKQVAYKSHPVLIEAYGPLRAIDKIELYSEVSGVLLRTPASFREGGLVAAGNTIIRMDDTDARLALYAQRSEFLNVLLSLMPDLKIDFPDFFPLWEKYLNSLKIENDLPELPEVHEEKFRFFLAARSVFTSYYNIRKAENLLKKYDIKAPFSGVITQSLVKEGALIRAGTKLGEFTGLHIYELELAVSTRDIRFLYPGAPVTVIDESGSAEFKGVLARLDPHIDRNSQSHKVFVSLKAESLKDGMFLKAIVSGLDMDSVIMLPANALHEDHFVYLLQDSLLHYTQVELIRLDKENAYIRGLKTKDILVTEALLNIEPNQRIIGLKD